MTETLLVHSVDDQLPECRLPDIVLRDAGYHVERWSDGEAFLHGADNSRPACVLLNLRQPEFDALAVQARMPAAGLDFPVIFMTEDIAVAVQAMSAGAIDVVAFPFDPGMVLRSIATAFDHLAEREAHRERAQSANLKLAGLSLRERQVLDRLACGYPNGAVAHEFDMGIEAVAACREDIIVKLALADFAAALRIAFAAGQGSYGSHGLAQG